MNRRRLLPVLFAACSLLFSAASAWAQINMPDPTQIAGRALPAPELPDGTVSVRVVREQLGNNVSAEAVKVTAGGVTKTGKTDDTGRAQITGLPPGAEALAETVVDGETLTSKPFAVPSKGGVRVILISGLAGAAERKKQEEAAAVAAPPTKGIVVFGGETRMVVEFQGDALQVFYLLDIVNTARTRVDIGRPLVLDLPQGAQGASLLQGSAPNAAVQGDHLTVTGPFVSGTTTVQVGFTLPHNDDTLTITQKFPAALEKVTVIAEKVGALHVTSPQFAKHGDVRAENGAAYIMGTGAGLPAGGRLVVEFGGLPVHPKWPRYTAVGFALGIVALGVWLSVRRSGANEARRRLSARREALYGELVKIEEQHRTGRIDPSRYASRRHQIVSELERIYGELDAAGGDEAAA